MCALTAVMLGALVLSACGSGGSGSDVIRLKFASGEPESHPLVQKIRWFMDEVEKRSDGRVEWKTYYAASLLPSTEIADGVGDGRADAGLFTSPYDPTDFPLYNIGYVPLPNANAVGAARGLRELYETNDALKAEADAAGVKFLLHLGGTNPATLLTTEKLTKLDQIKGKKLRYIGGISTAIKEAGANPIAIPAEEIYESQERGLVDGIGGASIGSIPAYNFQEVAPWTLFLPVGHFSGSMGMVFNADQWNDLPKDIQDLMLEVEEDFYKELPAMTMKGEVEACDAILDSGGGVAFFPADTAEGEQWNKDVGNKMFDGWRDTAVKTGVKEADALQVEKDFKESVLRFSKEATDYTPGEVTCAEKSDEKHK